MTRTRPTTTDVDKSAKKKSFDGKVTKHERKEKKSKKAAKLQHPTTPDSIDDESSKVGLRSPEQAQETALALRPYPNSIDEGGALLDGPSAAIVPVEDVEMLAIEQQSALGLKTTPPTSDDAGEIFMIDINPTPIDPRKLQPPSDDEDEDMEDGGAPLEKVSRGYTAPPSGMNRGLRRRLFLIEREKGKFQKKLGVPEGSNNRSDEVKELLDEWVQAFDKKSEDRQAKKSVRKMKNAALLRAKGRKMASGEKLQEKEKLRSNGGRQKSRQAIPRDH